jgi:Trm5-related predicted tRNA methylase
VLDPLCEVGVVTQVPADELDESRERFRIGGVVDRRASARGLAACLSDHVTVCVDPEG